jgi:hypothetical protein
MSDKDPSPVTVPAGSYDAAELAKGLDHAAGLSEAKRDDARAAAIAKARDGDAEEPDARTMPGYRWVDRDGERVQVYDPELAAKEAPEAITASSSDEKPARARSAAPTKE